MTCYRHNITQLQDGLFDGLRMLEILDFNHNNISSIGLRVFGGLSNLETLDLSYNGIAKLQNGLFDGLHKLKLLYLTFNEISSIGLHVFDGLSNLVTIQLSHNNITELQDGLFDGLHTLEILDLSHNNISSIGLRVFGSSATLSSLRDVDMSWNKIQTLDSWPIYLGINRYVTIDLSWNQIYRFTNLMRWKDNCGMKTAQIYMMLDRNPIVFVSDVLNGWNMSLLTTRCIQQPTRNFDWRIGTITCVYLKCDCVDLVKFQLQWRLWYDHTIDDVSQVRPLTLHVRPLTYQNKTLLLDQFECKLTERCPSGCRCVHRPVNATLHIDCSSANLTDLPLELPTPKSYPKYILDLSNNRLLRRLEHRDYFVNTSILDVSNSNIQQVESEDVWKAILKIPQLNLYGNKLMSLPQSIVSLNVTKLSLNIANNRWDCSCDNKWMSGWLNAIRDRLTRNVLCYRPPRLSGKNIVQTSEKEFCEDPAAEASKKAWKISMSSVAGVVVVLLSVIAIFYRLRVKLYTRWKFHVSIHNLALP